MNKDSKWKVQTNDTLVELAIIRLILQRLARSVRILQSTSESPFSQIDLRPVGTLVRRFQRTAWGSAAPGVG